MAQPTKLNFKMYQGSTFIQTLRWENSTKVYVPITDISKTAPMIVTAVAHGVPNGWRVKITGSNGMKEVNSDDYKVATSVTTNTITFNDINALNYATYTGGGILEYNQPVSLVGYTARMQIRAKLEDTSVIHEMTTSNGGVVIDNITKTIKLIISATTTAAFNFKNGVYSLELVGSGGEVRQLAAGSISLVKEVTR